LVYKEGVLKNKKIIKMSVGKEHSLVLSDTSESFSFGSNEFGQLG
jgi:alpha-tubulin suppressor-like RCC1 family protein